MLSLIVAYEENLGIGKNNTLPWKLKNEMEYFTKITSLAPENENNIVIMGRNTWDSIPKSFKPLKNRINIIITSRELELKKYNNTYKYKNLNDCLTELKIKKDLNYNKIFIIGGSKLYNDVLENELLNELYLTKIYDKIDTDIKFVDDKKTLNNILKKYDLISCSNFNKEYCRINNKDLYFKYFHYKKKNINNIIYKNIEEEQYLRILKNILLNGIKRGDRTGTGTLSVFGEFQQYNLNETFPLLTTKRMFFRGIFEELMLYIRGQTDNNILVKKGINIWNGNTSREFLDSRNLTHYKEGDMGETYGFNFRHFGGDYLGCDYNYKENKNNLDNGFDQIKNVIDLIKNNPESRRIIITLWNPKTNYKAALPSCLCWYQFYVNTVKNELDLIINIRSSDFFLANNWNICTGALLCHIICNLKDINLKPGNLKVISGDTHIYLNHLEHCKENLLRNPRPFPKLLINKEFDNIEDIEFLDLNLIGYEPYPNIKADMSV